MNHYHSNVSASKSVREQGLQVTSAASKDYKSLVLRASQCASKDYKSLVLRALFEGLPICGVKPLEVLCRAALVSLCV